MKMVDRPGVVAGRGGIGDVMAHSHPFRRRGAVPAAQLSDYLGTTN